MRATQIASFRQTSEAMLRRPWKKYRDGTLFYGNSKTGNKRLPLSTKQGNKNYYKGTRSSGIGHMDKFGQYKVNYNKVRTFVTPAGGYETPLKPLVSANVPVPRNSFRGYSMGAADGRLYFDQVKQFIEEGEVEYELSNSYIEAPSVVLKGDAAAERAAQKVTSDAEQWYIAKAKEHGKPAVQPRALQHY